MTEPSTIDPPAIDPSSAEFFERKYQRQPDPWNFGSSAYELERYEVTLQALAGRRFRHAFEPGCSVGVLTERLAHVCEQVDAIDLSATAVQAAKSRCAGFDWVDVRTGSLTDSPPEAEFDLIVLSEIGYYLDPGELDRCGKALVEKLSPGGWLLGVHWLGDSKDHRLSGDQVHTILHSLHGIRLEHAERHPGFRLDRWTKA